MGGIAGGMKELGHQGVDIPAILERVRRLTPNNPGGVWADIDILRDEIAYRIRQHKELQDSLHDFQERLGRLQRGTKEGNGRP